MCWQAAQYQRQWRRDERRRSCAKRVVRAALCCPCADPPITGAVCDVERGAVASARIKAGAMQQAFGFLAFLPPSHRCSQPVHWPLNSSSGGRELDRPSSPHMFIAHLRNSPPQLLQRTLHIYTTRTNPRKAGSSLARVLRPPPAAAATAGMSSAALPPAMEAQPVKSEPAAADSAQWSSLGTPAAELRLEWTLPTGETWWRCSFVQWPAFPACGSARPAGLIMPI